MDWKSIEIHTDPTVHISGTVLHSQLPLPNGNWHLKSFMSITHRSLLFPYNRVISRVRQISAGKRKLRSSKIGKIAKSEAIVHRAINEGGKGAGNNAVQPTPLICVHHPCIPLYSLPMTNPALIYIVSE
jgi:hypothetical protein